MGFLYIMKNMAVLFQFADLDILSKSVLDNLNFDLWCGKNAEWEDDADLILLNWMNVQNTMHRKQILKNLIFFTNDRTNRHLPS
jgi:hypothetical protein